MNRKRKIHAVGMLAALALGCGDDDAVPGDDADADAVSDVADDTPDAEPEAEVVEEADASPDSTGDGGEEDGDGDGGEYVPTPESVDLAAVNAIPSGEVILFNDWSGTPNSIRAIRPDGTDLGTIVTIARAWSFGATPSGDLLAIGGANYDEGAHFGIDGLGDAVQYTWLYDAGTEEVRLLSGGNVNDDCHEFTPDGSAVLVCRRWDFRRDGDSFVWEGYRIARIEVDDGEVTMLGDPAAQALSPAIGPADGRLYYTFYEFVGGSPHYQVRARALDTGIEVPIRDRAKSWVFSPDGTKAVFVDYADSGRLHVIGTDGLGEVAVTTRPTSAGRFSPDGARIVYTWDESMGCSHIEIVLADGTDAATPERIRPCVEGEWVTRVDWILRP